MYANGLKALESMLDLSTNITIKDLAIQFGCTPATELAMKTLQRYDTLWFVILNFQLKHSRDTIKDLCNIVVHVYLSLKIWSLCVIYLIRTYCFKSYEDEFKSKSGTEMDFTSPMFQATALCAACRWEKKEQIQLHLKYILRQSFLQGWFSNTGIERNFLCQMYACFIITENSNWKLTGINFENYAA